MMSGKRHRRTGGRDRSSYGRRTIAPVAELATKAPRGDARGTLGPARAVRSDVDALPRLFLEPARVMSQAGQVDVLTHERPFLFSASSAPERSVFALGLRV